VIDRTILLKFKEGTSQAKLLLVIERFKSLRDHLTGITDRVDRTEL
jgi:hypothetical protein